MSVVASTVPMALLSAIVGIALVITMTTSAAVFHSKPSNTFNSLKQFLADIIATSELLVLSNLLLTLTMCSLKFPCGTIEKHFETLQRKICSLGLLDAGFAAGAGVDVVIDAAAPTIASQ